MYVLLIFNLSITKQNKTGSRTGSCYSGDHIAREYKHTDIIICNIEEPQLKYRFRAVSNRLRGCGMEEGREFGGGAVLNMFYWIQTLAFCFCDGAKH